jgi:hypothetical protein
MNILSANWIPVIIIVYISLHSFHYVVAVHEGDDDLLKLKLGHGGPGKDDKVAKDPKKEKGEAAGSAVDLTLRISTAGDNDKNKNKGKAAENTALGQLQLSHRSSMWRESTAQGNTKKGKERVQETVNKNIKVGEKRKWPFQVPPHQQENKLLLGGGPKMMDVLHDQQQKADQTEQQRIISQNQRMEPAVAAGNEVIKSQYECKL